MVLIIQSRTSNKERIYDDHYKQNIQQIFALLSHLSCFAPSEPTFKHVCTLTEPRPSIELEHFAPRNVLPSLHVIENGCCDLMDLDFILNFVKKNKCKYKTRIIIYDR